jgi:hypothetical protein
MATNLAIDPDLLNRAVEVSGERTKKAVVTKALEEFIARREQRRIADLLGKLDWDESFDYKAERSRRT